MDPDATLTRAIEAALGGDYAEACEAFTDLGEWLARGGFPPGSGSQPLVLLVFSYARLAREALRTSQEAA